MRSVHEALEWYKSHQTAAQLGFNPNGMCQKVCRSARGIGSGYASALQQQRATPAKYRVLRVRDLVQGDVLYFDHPHDSNPFGHIVTQAGRVNGADPDALADLLLWTNSVVSGKLVIVRGDYFGRHWGDPFVYGGRWINGQALTYPAPKPPKPAYKIKPRTVHGPSLRRQFLRAAGVFKAKPTAINSVARVQQALNSVYDAGLTVDGTVGTKTLNAWGRHEDKVGVDGRPRIPDRKTLDALAKGRFFTSWETP